LAWPGRLRASSRHGGCRSGHDRRGGCRGELPSSVNIQAVAGTAILRTIAVAPHLAAGGGSAAVGNSVGTIAFTAVFDTSQKKIRCQTGSSATVNRHLRSWNCGATDTVRQGTPGSPLGIAARVGEAIHPGISLSPGDSRGVEEVEPARPTALWLMSTNILHFRAFFMSKEERLSQDSQDKMEGDKRGSSL